MNEKEKDDIYYFCCLIESISRITKNRRRDTIGYFTAEEIKRQLYLAQVNHCLSLEQVSDELIKKLGICDGDFDSVKDCRYKVPTVLSIGRVYQRLILGVNGNDPVKTIMEVFSSFISDAISNFNSSVYYSNPDYLQKSYEAGKLLD